MATPPILLSSTIDQSWGFDLQTAVLTPASQVYHGMRGPLVGNPAMSRVRIPGALHSTMECM